MNSDGSAGVEQEFHEPIDVWKIVIVECNSLSGTPICVSQHQSREKGGL